MVSKVNTVYRTDDPSIFKKLDGNRAITDGRVEKIKKSIRAVGYVQSPIIVNERYEIIDGQGRVEALKQLGMPIDFVIVKGAGLQECIALNVNLSNWKLTDYITSYAGQGNTSYQYLKLLMAEYGERFELHVIINAVHNLAFSAITKVKKGSFYCDTEMYEKARKTLDYEASFIEPLSRVDGRRRFYFAGINYVFNNIKIDKTRLVQQVQKLYPTLLPGINMKIALEELERVYNYGLKNKVMFYAHYQNYILGGADENA